MQPRPRAAWSWRVPDSPKASARALEAPTPSLLLRGPSLLFQPPGGKSPELCLQALRGPCPTWDQPTPSCRAVRLQGGSGSAPRECAGVGVPCQQEGGAQARPSGEGLREEASAVALRLAPLRPGEEAAAARSAGRSARARLGRRRQGVAACGWVAQRRSLPAGEVHLGSSSWQAQPRVRGLPRGVRGGICETVRPRLCVAATRTPGRQGQARQPRRGLLSGASPPPPRSIAGRWGQGWQPPADRQPRTRPLARWACARLAAGSVPHHRKLPDRDGPAWTPRARGPRAPAAGVQTPSHRPMLVTGAD